ncbi:hypothetical protein FIBSPDRAFT_934191 [Athelia psychrophila]|uniref:Uncharacterized protein n=1 Tax=Athelia psychrophila TaxID=1759441 RepID=A0A166FR26_9AGAM|nr:hypothetical protein FIBSPDRAFT_934191 [Fibularhizoctonia sp. CBS 109695]
MSIGGRLPPSTISIVTGPPNTPNAPTRALRALLASAHRLVEQLALALLLKVIGTQRRRRSGTVSGRQMRKGHPVVSSPLVKPESATRRRFWSLSTRMGQLMAFDWHHQLLYDQESRRAAARLGTLGREAPPREAIVLVEGKTGEAEKVVISTKIHKCEMNVMEPPTTFAMRFTAYPSRLPPAQRELPFRPRSPQVQKALRRERCNSTFGLHVISESSSDSAAAPFPWAEECYRLLISMYGLIHSRGKPIFKGNEWVALPFTATLADAIPLSRRSLLSVRKSEFRLDLQANAIVWAAFLFPSVVRPSIRSCGSMV